MEGIFILTVDDILYVLQHLDVNDKIAFAYTCERFRQICMDERVFRKLDLSDRRILRRQQTAINELFRDRQMAKHIRELNFNNCHIMTWQMNDQLEEFIMSICPHLEALHVLNCGMSFQTLHRILKQAPKLASLSWSLMGLKPGKDTKFLMNSWKSSDGMCLKNIKHLCLEIVELKPYIQILKYLVLSLCKYVEELKIYKWKPSEMDLEFETSCDNPAFPPQPVTSISDTLPHLHSLIVVEFGRPLYSTSLYTRELSDFISSVVRKKSSETKWKKLWIAPPTDGDLHDMFPLTASSVILPKKHPHELHSIEAFIARVGPSLDTLDNFKTLFQKIDDNTVKNLHVCIPSSRGDLILEVCKPILRTGGRTLKFLGLFVDSASLLDAEAHLFFNTLFSGCLNIKDLDLLECHFEDNICEALCKLKHLDKIQLQECGIFAQHNENQVEITKANLLTFVGNCQNITELDVRGCYHDHEEFTSRNIDDDLIALAKLTKLRSLTLFEVSGIKEWTFLPNISAHCKFLSMLRISTLRYFNKSCIPVILKSAKYLKDLAITVPRLDLGLEDPWKLLSHATNLERLCIRSKYIGYPNVSGAIGMLKSLPQLHVLHLHSFHVGNIEFFCDEIAKTLKEEESDYSICFELLGHSFESPSVLWFSSEPLPLNAVDMCYMRPILANPTL